MPRWRPKIFNFPKNLINLTKFGLNWTEFQLKLTKFRLKLTKFRSNLTKFQSNWTKFDRFQLKLTKFQKKTDPRGQNFKKKHPHRRKFKKKKQKQKQIHNGSCHRKEQEKVLTDTIHNKKQTRRDGATTIDVDQNPPRTARTHAICRRRAVAMSYTR